CPPRLGIGGLDRTRSAPARHAQRAATIHASDRSAATPEARQSLQYFPEGAVIVGPQAGPLGGGGGRRRRRRAGAPGGDAGRGAACAKSGGESLSSPQVEP